MTTKLKELFHKDFKKNNYENTWLLLTNEEKENGDETGTNKIMRKHGSTTSLPNESKLSNSDLKEQTDVRYKQITRKLSQEMQNFVPSPEMIRKRRNATCDEIEKKTITDIEGHTLRQDRVDMLKAVALREMNLI